MHGWHGKSQGRCLSLPSRIHRLRFVPIVLQDLMQPGQSIFHYIKTAHEVGGFGKVQSLGRAARIAQDKNSEPRASLSLPLRQLHHPSPQSVAMSSKNRHKSRRSNNYPTGWSEWQWSDEHQCKTRYREVTEGMCVCSLSRLVIHVRLHRQMGMGLLPGAIYS